MRVSLGFFFIVIASFLWALDTLFRYPLINKVQDVLLVVLGEHILLSLFFFPVIIGLWKKRKLITREDLFNLFVVGALGSGLATYLFTKAFSLGNPTIVILVQKIQPLVACTWAYFYLKDSLPKNFKVILLIAITGSVLLSGEVNKITTLSFNINESVLYALSAAVIWGLSTVSSRKLSQGALSTVEIMALRYSFALFFLILWLAGRSGGITNDLWGSLFPEVIYLVTISGVLAMAFYYRGIRSVSAYLATIGELFFALFAIIINWWFLGMKIQFLQLIGAGLLVISSLMVYKKNSEKM